MVLAANIYVLTTGVSELVDTEYSVAVPSRHTVGQLRVPVSSDSCRILWQVQQTHWAIDGT